MVMTFGGYSFKNQGLYKLALTHKSIARDGVGNERLEFLGDRILGLIVADVLYYRFPQDSEGVMATRYTRLVEKKCLAGIGKKIAIDKVLALALREDISTLSEAMVADTLEALIAATYLDGGWEVVQELVLRLWADDLSSVGAREVGELIDSKTQLQEYTQGRGWGLPLYRVIDKWGSADHLPTFLVEVCVGDKSIAKASGSNKRKAQQVAARRALEKFLSDDKAE